MCRQASAACSAEANTRRQGRDASHGRYETRSVRTLTVTSPDLEFPHVIQAAKIPRHRTDLNRCAGQSAELLARRDIRIALSRTNSLNSNLTSPLDLIGPDL